MPIAERIRSSDAIAADLREKLQNIPGVKIRTRAGQGLFILRMGSSDNEEKLQVEIRGHDLALLSLAGAYSQEGGELRIAVGSAAPTPVMIPPIANITQTDDFNEVGNGLTERVLPFISPIDDVRASASYRREMTKVLCKRLAEALLKREEGGYHAA